MPSLHLSQDMIDFFYPVGSYYETSNTSFDPNVKWGGTWVEDSSGRVPVSYDSTQSEFNSVGKTGGSKYIQNHKHKNLALGGNIMSAWSSTGTGNIFDLSAIFKTNQHNNNEVDIGYVNEVQTGNSGNLQPYVVVKRWHRTA